MKKFYSLSLLLTGLFIAGSLNVSAQEMIVGGDMESADSWTIVDLAAGDGHTETFGYTDDKPTDGTDGCLSMAGIGNWANAAICQAITLKRGVDYKISMVVKTIDLVVESTWAEVVITDTIPSDDGYITTFPINMAINSWDCADVTSIDGPFEENSCVAKLVDANEDDGAVRDIINIEGEGDTTVVLVLKAGGGAVYNILFDNVSVMGPGSSSIKNTLSNISIFPTQLENELNIQLASEIKDVSIVNLLGQTVSAFKNINSKEVSVNVSELSSGVYYVVVTDINNMVGTAKAIKL